MANIDDLDEDFIICSGCNKEYDENGRFPKLLPCLHTLCTQCVDASVRGTLVRCGVCQEDHKLSRDTEILPDSTMRNMMDLIKIQRKPSLILCSDCPDSNNGVDFCKDCYDFLCSECTSAHKRTHITRKHVIIPLDDLKHSGIGCFTKKEMCSVSGHEDQPFAFYCDKDECRKPICTPCAVTDHNQADGHIIKNLKDIYEDSKRLVDQMVGELLKKISYVSSSTKQLETDCSRIEEQKEDTKKQIDQTFDNLVAILESRKNNLKQQVDDICINKKQSVTEQLKQLQSTKSSMENSCNYSSRMIVFTNKPEFLQLKDAVISKLSAHIDTDIDIKESETLSLTFGSKVDTSQFKDFVENIGAVESNTANGIGIGHSHDSMNHIGNEIPTRPYPGPPRHPPGISSNSPFQSYRSTSHVAKPVVEPLKLSKLQGDRPLTRPYSMAIKPVAARVPSKMPSIEKLSPPVEKVSATPGDKDNVLGRSLSLKQPVISPSKQPTSLGDFLNELQNNKLFHREYDDPEEDKYQVRSFQLVIRRHTLQNSLGSPRIEDESQEMPVPDVQNVHPEKHITPSPEKQVIASPVSPPSKFTFNSSPSPVKTPTSYIEEAPSRVNGTVNNSFSKYDSPRQSTDTESSKEETVSAQPTLTESSYPVAKQTQSPVKPTPSDKPIVFGDVTCPEFMMDTASAHHEREVTEDGKTLRNKKTDVFSGGSIDLENHLVMYKGAIGTCPFKDPGKYYYEVDVMYNIQQPLEETWLVFEIGLCRLDDVDMHHTVERHEHARSFYVARYPEDGKLTQEFWHNRDLLGFSPLSDNSPGLEVRVTYGLLVDTKRKKWIIADCNNNKIIHTFEKLDFSEALYPVFGCYNPDLVTVELTVRTGMEITMIPQCIKPGYRSP